MVSQLYWGDRRPDSRLASPSKYKASAQHVLGLGAKGFGKV